MTAFTTFKLGLSSKRLTAVVPKEHASRVLGMMESGIYYGYPKCCIEEFIAFYLGAVGYMAQFPRPDRIMSGTGYVPCECCSHKDGDQLRSNIDAYRLAIQPFPREQLGVLDNYREVLSNRGVLLRMYIDSDARRAKQVEYLISCLSAGHPYTIVTVPKKERNEPRQRVVPQPPAQAQAADDHGRGW